jgi:hypothetical protein
VANSLNVDASNPQLIYSGSINGGYRSTGGGWAPMHHPDFRRRPS